MTIEAINPADYAGHTPGDWKITERTGMAKAHYGTNVSASHYSTPTCCSGEDAVCDCAGTHGDANARLIAAAPRLLRTCVALQERVKRLEEALQEIIKSEPVLCGDGSCGYPHHGPDGDDAGFERVDPLGVVGSMVSVARAALDEGGSQ